MSKLMRRADRADRVRVASLDMAHSQRRSTVVVGPVALPPLDELIDRYDALAARGPTVRLCLEPSMHTDRWRTAAPDATAVIGAVDALSPDAPPTDLLPAVRAIRTDEAADGIRILCAGDELVIDFCHGLGEVPFIHLVLDALLGAVDPRDPDLLAPYRHRRPLLRAASGTFGTHPGRLASVLRGYRGRAAKSPVENAATADGRAFQPAPTTRYIGLPAEVVTELRKRRDETLPDVSLVALCTYALWEGFAEVGLRIDDTVKIPFDVRRYLPARSNTLASFTAGLDFTITSDGGPMRLQAEMNRALHSGRPVVTLMAGTLHARRRAPRTTEYHPRDPRVRLLHSNVGWPENSGRWPFTDHGLAHMLVASDPIGAEGMTVTSSSMLGNLWLTAKFHGTVFDSDLVSAALSTVEARVRDLTSSRLG